LLARAASPPIRIIAIILLALGLTCAIAGPAAAGPAAVTGYHADGPIHPAAHPLQCLGAVSAHPGQAVFIESCKPHDSLQTWGSARIAGTVLIWLLATPDWCMSGEPNAHGQLQLFDCNEKSIPVREGMFVGGGTGEGAQNTLRNIGGQYVMGSGTGPADWRKLTLSTLKTNRKWVFQGGWHPVTEEANPR
jgi:hypothetical protein